MGIGIPIIDKILGIGEKVIDRVVPDTNKRADQSHDRAQTQANITLEGEKQRNWFTPRAIIMYACAFSVVYGVVVQPTLKAFGVDIPVIDYSAPLRLLLGLLGLEFAG